MTRKNYYAVLGIARTESPSGIRSAYRDLAKRFHPDRGGASGTEQFQLISEAYGVLSDPVRRRGHDRELEEAAALHAPHPGASVEPLVAEPGLWFGEGETVRPSVEALHDRFARNFTGRGVPKSEGPQDLTIDVVLTPEEAARGGRFRLRFPTLRPCSLCRGSGYDWLAVCFACYGMGFLRDPRAVIVEFPPGVPPNTVFERSLESAGIGNLYLRLRFLVE